MARRRKTGAMDDIAELVARLPWWAGVALALVLYLVLHSVASQPVVIDAQPGKIGNSVVRSMGQALANVGQYVLPFICLIGAAMSAWRRRERKSLLANATGSNVTDAFDGMSWREFEMLVGEGFRLQGYEVVETGRDGADGGVDLVLNRKGRNGNEVPGQCKQWRAFKVGVDVVRELYGVMAARGATGGFVVTSGRFTAEAVDFASGRNVTLVDGPRLHGLIRQARPRARAQRPSLLRHRLRSPPRSPCRLSAVLCALARPMARRTAKLGPNPGSEFWGCTAYPACRGTRPIA